jgi:hypothetical protein
MNGTEELDSLKESFNIEMHDLFTNPQISVEALELRLHRRLDSFHAMAKGSLRHRDEGCRRARIIQVLWRVEQCIQELRRIRLNQNSASDDPNLDGGGECPPETPYLCDGFCAPYPCV